MYATNINKEVSTSSVSAEYSRDDSRKDLLDYFFLRVKRKIVHGREAYLLTDLLRDFKKISEDMGFEAPVISTKEIIDRKIPRGYNIFLPNRA